MTQMQSDEFVFKILRKLLRRPHPVLMEALLLLLHSKV